jgi:dihydrolipoamide dehydrogenase
MADTKAFDLVIIGAGPGGYVAAVRAAQLGMKVACIEKEPRLGGVCLNTGCIPSKALLDSSEYYHLAKHRLQEHGIIPGEVQLDLGVLMARKDRVVQELTENVRRLLEGNQVEIIHGTARLSSPNQVEISPGDSGTQVDPPALVRAGAILLATGSEPVEVPGLAFDGMHVVTSTEALSFSQAPQRLGIVGGGYIGLELGSVWQRLGAQVTVIEMLPRLAASLDGQVARALERTLTNQGLNFRLNTRVVKAQVSAAEVLLTLESAGNQQQLTCDRLLVAVGRRPLTRGLGIEELGVGLHPKTGQVLVDEHYRTSIPTIYAIGDLIAGPMLAHKASAEGIAAVECSAGLPGEVNYDAIPAVIYTWPEVASVGLTEEQARERGIDYCVGAYPFTGSGRARCMGETDGFVKLIAQKSTDRLLGAHIIGPRAADMIAECVLALEFGASSEDIARTVHGHPTFAEALQEAALGVRKCSIYSS